MQQRDIATNRRKIKESQRIHTKNRNHTQFEYKSITQIFIYFINFELEKSTKKTVVAKVRHKATKKRLISSGIAGCMSSFFFLNRQANTKSSCRRIEKKVIECNAHSNLKYAAVIQCHRNSSIFLLPIIRHARVH